jgi:hypothetical protein
MAPRIHSVDQFATHSPANSVARGTRTSSTPSTPVSGASTAQTQNAVAPSFSAVFAQIAAAAAVAGTTVASTAAVAPVPSAATQQATSTPAGGGPSSDPAGPLFGPNPWLTDPTGSGPNGTVTNYNPVYFATQQTAQTVAQMLGGKVVESNQIITAPGSPFTQDEPNYMVQLPDGAQVNPGFIADIYAHGWSQSLINEQVANEVAGAEAAVGS